MIYHITSARQVEDARRAGDYAPVEFEAEGFIHCSYAHQVIGVANARFKGRGDLVLLQIDRSRVPARVVDEQAPGTDRMYPHIYGRIPMSAVVAVHAFPPRPDGHFELPRAVTTD